MSLWVHKSVEPWHAKTLVSLFLGFLLVCNVVVVVIVVFPPQPLCVACPFRHKFTHACTHPSFDASGEIFLQ